MAKVGKRKKTTAKKITTKKIVAKKKVSAQEQRIPKGSSLKDRIKLTNRFVPVPKETLHEPEFVLTGSALERYERARKQYADRLPDKKPRNIEAKLIDKTLAEVRESRRAAIAYAAGKLKRLPSDLYVPKTIKCNLGTEALRYLKLKKMEVKVKEDMLPDSFFVKFGDLQDCFLPAKSLVAPDNPALSLLEPLTTSTIRTPVVSPARSEAGGPSTEADIGTEIERQLDKRLDSLATALDESDKSHSVLLATRLAKLLDSARAELEGTSSGQESAQSRRQTKLYESLGEDAAKPLESPVDAIAYHDFFDLKIAWTPLWTKALGEGGKTWTGKTRAGSSSLEEAPGIVKLFLSETETSSLWNACRDEIEREGDSTQDLLRDSALHALYGHFLGAMNPGAPYSTLTKANYVPDMAKAAGLDPTEQETEYDFCFGMQSSHWGVLVYYARHYADWRVVLEDIINKFTQEPDGDDWIDTVGLHNWVQRVKHYRSLRAQIKDRWEYLKDATSDKDSAVGSSDPLYPAQLSEGGYDFPFFAPGTVNYGVLLNYRQEWAPKSWQVGELIKTIPLAPKEVRKYKTVLKENKKRHRKEIEKSLSARRSDESTTTRAEAEIVNRASGKTDFSIAASGGISLEIGEIGGNANASSSFKTEAGSDSSDTKKKFREAVAKAAREVSNERQIEILEEESTTLETEFVGEISNPNDELTVTYLFYELQRRYQTAEFLHKADAVILIAEEIPSADEIDWDWILRFDWILKRVLLDDSFAPSLEYVQEGRNVVEHVVEVARARRDAVQGIFDAAKNKLENLSAGQTAGEAEMRAYSASIYSLASSEDPFPFDVWEGVVGGDEGQQIEALEARREAASARLERIAQRLGVAREEVAMKRNALDRAVDEYNKAFKERELKIRHVERFINHIRDNLLYYQQAIWSYEPGDQRYLRLFDRKVDFFEYPEDDNEVMVRVRAPFGDMDTLAPGTPFEVILPEPSTRAERRLDEVADLNNLLGFKGNYLIFPLRRQSYLTAYMMQDYFGGNIDEIPERDKTPGPALSHIAAKDTSIVWGVWGGTDLLSDPDPSPYTYGWGGERVMGKSMRWGGDQASTTAEPRTTIDELIRRGVIGPRTEPEDIIVRTNSLYIEALPGKHPLLEDFKLDHRKVDLQKAKAEHFALVLDNVRAEARLLQLDFEDPKVDKIVRVDGAAAMVQVSADENKER